MGQNVLFPLRRLSEREMIPTGFPDVDTILGGDGIRSGQVTAICGKPTSGATSLTYSIMAQAQRQNRNVLTIDLGETFNPYSAMQWGVEPGHILKVRSEEVLASVDVVRAVVRNTVKSLIILDTIDMKRSHYFLQLLQPTVVQLKGELVKSNCAILVLLPKVPSPAIQADYETVLKLELKEWIYSHEQINGYRVLATLVKDSKINGEPTACIDILLKGEPH